MFRNGGGNTVKVNKKAFTGMVWDENHIRVKAGRSKILSTMSCSLEAWPMQGCNIWNKHILPTSAGRRAHLGHAGSMDAGDAGSPCRGTKVQAVGSVCTTTGTGPPLLLTLELHHHLQEVPLLQKDWVCSRIIFLAVGHPKFHIFRFQEFSSCSHGLLRHSAGEKKQNQGRSLPQPIIPLCDCYHCKSLQGKCKECIRWRPNIKVRLKS